MLGYPVRSNREAVERLHKEELHRRLANQQKFGVVEGQTVTIFGESLQVFKLDDDRITLKSPKVGHRHRRVVIPFIQWESVRNGGI